MYVHKKIIYSGSASNFVQRDESSANVKFRLCMPSTRNCMVCLASWMASVTKLCCVLNDRHGVLHRRHFLLQELSSGGYYHYPHYSSIAILADRFDIRRATTAIIEIFMAISAIGLKNRPFPPHPKDLQHRQRSGTAQWPWPIWSLAISRLRIEG